MENNKYQTVGTVHNPIEKQQIPHCRNSSQSNRKTTNTTLSEQFTNRKTTNTTLSEQFTIQ